jgi:S-DNA-T family DNA segregation ATPase FtsK/SpoIIIE
MSEEKNRKKNVLKGSNNSDSASNEKVKKKKKSSSNVNLIDFFNNEKTIKVSGVFFIVFSIFILFSIISFFFTWWIDYDQISSANIHDILFDETLEISNWTGRLGAAISYLLIIKWFGISSLAFALFFFTLGLRVFKITLFKLSSLIKYSLFLLIFLSVSFGFFFKTSNLIVLGGEFGYEVSKWLEGLLGKLGTIILLIFGLSSFIIVTFNKVLNFNFNNWSKKEETETEETDNDENNDKIVSRKNILKTESNEEEITDLDDDDYDEPGSTDFVLKVKETPPKTENKKEEIVFTVENPDNIDNENNTTEIEKEEVAFVEEKPRYTIDSEFDPKLELSTYEYPGLNLLTEANENPTSVQNDELIANKNRIIETLRNYAIEIVEIKATIGPTVTLYEIIPAPGIRISKIKNLENDIALSLSALGIRIIAPIPGKGTIGIEVPNKNPQIVSMRTMLNSDKFKNSKFELPIAIGKTISNEPYIADLTRMPHLLMAGATGQGKSVGLNAIIASLLYKKHPAELKFVLVDPKKVELSLFSKIERHFLAKLPDSEEAIITDTRKVVRTLNSLTIEMDQRYDLLKDAQVKNIKEYNTKFIARKLNPNEGHRFLPYIVLVIDEFADLIMTAGKEIETPIARLAQLARAIGIHLIIATQRPSVNIITGTIKANFPARIAFRVTSKIDSRTILDIGGADQLIGRGDMLLSTGSDLIRLQCAFIDTPEIESVVDFIGSQRGYPSPFNLPEYLDEDSEPNKDFDPSQKDELFEEAARIIVAHQHGSTSLLQRKLKLGYNRAGRIIDQLEAAGIVGPFEGSKAREVKFKDEISLEQFLKENS